MSTTQPTNKTVTPELIDEQPSSAALLGIDSEGRTHYVGNRPVDNSIYVKGSETVEKYPIDELPVDVEGWMSHVEHKTGWERELYEVGLVERLAEVLQK